MIQYASIILMLIGIYGLLSQKNIIKIIVSLNIFEIGLNILIVSIGYINNGKAPILTTFNSNSNVKFVDPLPQALVLTSIVIGVGITALGLAFARKLYKKYNTFELDEMEVR